MYHHMLAVGFQLNALDGSNPHEIRSVIPFDFFRPDRDALEIGLFFHHWHIL
jgi:hypothetical protein